MRRKARSPIAGGTIGANKERRKICLSERGVDDLRSEAAEGGASVAEEVNTKRERRLKGGFKWVVK
ncbi:MAG: hypothetical protein QW687_06270 [Candidatus Hadarchaeales archaeon]